MTSYIGLSSEDTRAASHLASGATSSTSESGPLPSQMSTSRFQFAPRTYLAFHLSPVALLYSSPVTLMQLSFHNSSSTKKFPRKNRTKAQMRLTGPATIPLPHHGPRSHPARQGQRGKPAGAGDLQVLRFTTGVPGEELPSARTVTARCSQLIGNTGSRHHQSTCLGCLDLVGKCVRPHMRAFLTH